MSACLECTCIFQSTLPYGSDSVLPFFLSVWRKFQSTLPYGSDCLNDFCKSHIGISIHAPLRERPHSFRRHNLSSTISIHAPLRERRCGKVAPPAVNKISIHAPLRERLKPALVSTSAPEFQSTLPYGSDGRFSRTE